MQTAFLGDLLLGIPLLKRLRLRFPEATLHLVCRQGLGTFLLHLKVIDQFYEIKKGQTESYKLCRQSIGSTVFDLVVCPHESIRSAWFVRSLKARHKVGFLKRWNSWAFTNRLEKDFRLPEALRQMSLLTPWDSELGLKIEKYKQQNSIDQLSTVPEWASMKIDEINVSSKENLICLFPGSVWSTKQWTETGFAEVANTFLNQGREVYLLGGSSERGLADRLKKLAPRVKNYVGQTDLKDTLEYLRRSIGVVCNDSAGQHLASVAGTPCVSIFGPTVLSLGFQPWNPHSVVVQRDDVQCRPCGKHGHKECPLGTHACMRKIPSADVLQAIRSAHLWP